MIVNLAGLYFSDLYIKRSVLQIINYGAYNNQYNKYESHIIRVGHADRDWPGTSA